MIMIMLMMAYDDDECTARQCPVAVAPTLSGFDDDDDYDDDRIEDGVNDGDE